MLEFMTSFQTFTNSRFLHIPPLLFFLGIGHFLLLLKQIEEELWRPFGSGLDVKELPHS